jgi:hypothetical protein
MANEHRRRTGVEPPGPEGATCRWCGQGMKVTLGCVAEPRLLVDGPYEPVRVDEERSYPCPSRCGDCSAAPGHVHHPGCDIAECPRGGWQLLSWGCYGPDDVWI